MQRLTCFLGEGLNHVTGGSTPCTVAGPDFHKILGVGQEVLHSGRVLLAGDLDSVCSRFFVMSSPVPNLQTVKLGDVSLWFRHFRCEKPFPIGSDLPPPMWAEHQSLNRYLMSAHFYQSWNMARHTTQSWWNMAKANQGLPLAWNNLPLPKKREQQKILCKMCLQNWSLKVFATIISNIYFRLYLCLCDFKFVSSHWQSSLMGIQPYLTKTFIYVA